MGSQVGVRVEFWLCGGWLGSDGSDCGSDWVGLGWVFSVWKSGPTRTEVITHAYFFFK